MISRHEWGAADPIRPLTAEPVAGKSLTLHWRGTFTDDAHVDCAPTVRTIQMAHQTHPVERYADIAYNFLVCAHGEVFEGRGWGYRTGANGSSAGNSESVAVCYIGGPGNDLTTAAAVAIRLLRNELGSLGGSAEVWSHGDWTATECPGTELRNLAAELHNSAFTMGDTMLRDDFDAIASIVGTAAENISAADQRRFMTLAGKLDELLDRVTKVDDLSSVSSENLLAELRRRL